LLSQIKKTITQKPKPNLRLPFKDWEHYQVEVNGFKFHFCVSLEIRQYTFIFEFLEHGQEFDIDNLNIDSYSYYQEIQYYILYKYNTTNISKWICVCFFLFLEFLMAELLFDLILFFMTIC